MDACSSGEDLIVKIRKPYTITKQRERWTEDEHNRFLEALKLYGRAWQRIEEHIGTKTAVQIRSHAQKFFSKLEKEATLKGISLAQAHDIDIPPPRPKRKPSNPYPRKVGSGSLSSSGEVKDGRKLLTSQVAGSQTLAMKEVTPGERPATETRQRKNGTSEDGSFSDVYNLFQDTPSVPISHVKENCENPDSFRVFVPLVQETSDKTLVAESSVTIKGNEETKSNGAVKFHKYMEGMEGVYKNLRAEPIPEEIADVTEKPEMLVSSVMDNSEGFNSYQTYVQVKENSSAKCQGTAEPQRKIHSTVDNLGVPSSVNPFTTPIISVIPEAYTNFATIPQPIPSFPPFTQFCSIPGAAYRSFMNVSSTFSHLVLSTLLQNPAVHAAACLAASFWPSSGIDASAAANSTTSEVLGGEVPGRPMNGIPSMTAIAAGTVAAATAWWAMHGLLPLFPPHSHSGLTFTPTAATTTTAKMDMAQPSDTIRERGGEFRIPAQDQKREQPHPPGTEYALPKSLISSSASDSDESQQGERPQCSTDMNASKANNKFKLLPQTELQDCSNTGKKKADLSSCGSNTPSCSEIDIVNAMEKANAEESKEAGQHCAGFPLSSETNHRRFRCSGIMNEAWKEVSEEGRVAFQALFKREVLPQNFSLSHPNEKGATALPVDLNRNVCSSIDPDNTEESQTDVTLMISSENSGKSCIISEPDRFKLKAHRTGFKPYKRCSVEAKENRVASGDDQVNKRIRLEAEASN